MAIELIFTLVIIIGIAILIDKIYARVHLDHYSPIWEYFSKSFLYGFIAIFTMHTPARKSILFLYIKMT